MTTGCFVSPGRSLERALERVKLADSRGFDSVFTTHIAGADSLTLLAAYALSSDGFGSAPASSRSTPGRPRRWPRPPPPSTRSQAGG